MRDTRAGRRKVGIVQVQPEDRQGPHSHHTSLQRLPVVGTAVLVEAVPLVDMVAAVDLVVAAASAGYQAAVVREMGAVEGPRPPL